MPGPSGGGRSGSRAKRGGTTKQLIDTLREACPPQKIKDLEALVASLQGDEEKIREKISEWWEEPDEGEWEDVNKKNSGTVPLKPASKFNGRGGRGGRISGEFAGRGRGVSRGGRSGRDGRGTRGGRSSSDRGPKPGRGERTEEANPAVATSRAPQGAWAKKGETEPPLTVGAEEMQTPTILDEPLPPAPEPSPPVPTPAPQAAKVTAVAVTTGGSSVWATKGSAHLIQAEKPKPPPPVAPRQKAPIQRKTVEPEMTSASTTVASESSPIAAPQASMTSSVIASVPTNASVVAGLSPTQEPVSVQPPKEVMAPPPPRLNDAPTNVWSNSTTDTSLAVESSPNVAQASPKPVQPLAPAPPPASVLNMGRWDAGDTDDNLDFGFGSFGNVSNDPSTVGSVMDDAKAVVMDTVPGASPARPPPGLSISGMPPMPANAVLVHELENKLDEVSVSKPPPSQQASSSPVVPQNVPQQPPPPVPQAPPMPHHQQPPHHHQPPPHLDPHQPYSSSNNSNSTSNANTYGMGVGAGGGMYGSGYGASANNAFVGMGGPLGGSKQQVVPPLQQPQPGLYGSAPSSGNAPTGLGAASSSSDTNPNSGSNNSNMPPGMPGMPYGNPMYYGHGQQQFHMGQHQPSIGYNYGYGGQFAGSVQGGFGYPGAMHGNAGYGHNGPQYDEGAGGGTGTGYNPQQQPKNSGGGGYRGGGGRNPHHNAANNNNSNSQYQGHQQYGGHQQHYGGQPYGMIYHNDHFNQRGGYGSSMQDPYSMQQQQHLGSFPGDNDQYKGKKGGRGGGGLNHFQQQQQVPPNQHLSGGSQPPFGLQGQRGAADSTQHSNDGWPSHHHGGGGTTGWNSGGSSGWQGK